MDLESILLASLVLQLIEGQVFQYFIVNNNDQTAKVIDTVKLPTCTHLDQAENVTLRGGIKSGKFTKHGEVESMKDCIGICCQEEKCDVALMPAKTCYTVQCHSDKMCESVPATQGNKLNGTVQISHIIRGGGKGDDVDEFRKKNGVNRNSLPNGDRCVFSQVKYNHIITGGQEAGEIIDLGRFVDVYDCAEKCCQHENCEVAYISNKTCYAVDCFTKDLCRSSPSTALSKDDIIVYMNKRNNKRQRNKETCDGCTHGICTGKNLCTCDAGYEGPDCSKQQTIGKCDPECGDFGECLRNNTCSCVEGWTGYKCSDKEKCISGCSNGVCVRKNVCKCDIGWTGPQCNESTTDKLILASSGEEVLFTDTAREPELDIKIHDSRRLHEDDSISFTIIVIGCIIIATMVVGGIIFVAKHFLNNPKYQYLILSEGKDKVNRRLFCHATP